MMLWATIFFFIEVFSHAYVEFANSRLPIALNVSRHTCCLFQNIREISMISSSSCVILILKLRSIKSLWIKYILKLIIKMAGAAVGSLAFDEYGRPFLILRDQNNQNRITGKDAIKVITWYSFTEVNPF